MRMGLGLAAVGRPGYINLGRYHDLPHDRSPEAMRRRTHELLDHAYAHGVRYVDVARSYGRAEEFLADWLDSREDVDDLRIGSKWGYTYTAGWRVTAAVHEVKDHSVAAFDRQLTETRALLGSRLDLYQVHSVTPESPALTDTSLHGRLVELAAEGVTIGMSTSGPGQRDAIRAALDITVDGVPLFRSVKATWNVFEPSTAGALAEAHEAGCAVIVKEALANGRIARRVVPPALAAVADECATTCDAVALAAALHQPWATIVLSGAATTAQLGSNLGAASVTLKPDQLVRLAELAEPPERYWQTRSRLSWA
jgi:aryl-alcohol dehydrogenase-like predicted oxidoreductase